MVKNTQPRTVQQAASEWNVSPHTVRAWIAQRRIASLRLGRSLRIPYEVIEGVLEEGLTPAGKEWKP